MIYENQRIVARCKFFRLTSWINSELVIILEVSVSIQSTLPKDDYNNRTYRRVVRKLDTVLVSPNASETSRMLSRVTQCMGDLDMNT